MQQAATSPAIINLECGLPAAKAEYFDLAPVNIIAGGRRSQAHS